ncbi:MAG: S-ribosylhomocysteine lyase, partial [Bacteroidales bacterium]
CRTGNYLIISGDYNSCDIVDLMKKAFTFVMNYDGEIPGAAPKDCGDWSCHDLLGAKVEADKYLTEVLNVITVNNLVYPK